MPIDDRDRNETPEEPAFANAQDPGAGPPGAPLRTPLSSIPQVGVGRDPLDGSIASSIKSAATEVDQQIVRWVVAHAHNEGPEEDDKES